MTTACGIPWEGESNLNLLGQVRLLEGHGTMNTSALGSQS